jgi:Pectate lyase superfamily protein
MAYTNFSRASGSSLAGKAPWFFGRFLSRCGMLVRLALVVSVAGVAAAYVFRYLIIDSYNFTPTPTLTPAATPSPTPGSPLTLVSAAKYASLEQGIANERYLFIPAGTYNLSRPLSIKGWRGGVIMGAGRFTTILNAQSSGGAFKIEDSQDVYIGNLSTTASSRSQGVAGLETVGTTTSSLFLFSMTNEGPHMGESATDPGPTALKFGAPGVIKIQGIHVTGLGVGVSVENTNADVSIMGGNYQSNRTHIRQVAGHLEIRSSGFQIAHGGADIEIQSPSSKAPHLIEGLRSEGPDSLLRVPATTEKVDVLLRGASLAGAKRIVQYHATGLLGMVANNFWIFKDEGQGPLIETSEAATMRTLGNILGTTFLAKAPFVLSGGALAISTGDLWWAGDDNANLIIKNQSFAKAGKGVPQGVSFTSPGGTVTVPPIMSNERKFTHFSHPKIQNLGSLFVNVKDYGAKGDGTTDDYTNIMKAVAAVRDSPSGGRARQSLYFPVGRYRVSKPIFLDHWAGGGFYGEGPDQSVIVSSSGKSVFLTNSTGYTTFVGLGLETSTGAIEPVFDLSWDGSAGNPSNGAALQANMFYNIRFQGGEEGLSIGGGGYMGSENFIVESTFKHSNAGMAVHNYNALANVAVACVFENVKIAVEQENAGSFNVYNSTMKNIREAGVTMKNSASDTFVLDHINYQEPVKPFIMQGNMTGATINILVNGSTLAPSPKTAQPSIAMEYYAGGSVVFLHSALGGRVVHSAGSIGEKALILDTRSKNTSSHSVGGNAKKYFVSP